MSLHLAIVGSGQLARMMALDGLPMGIRFSFLAEEAGDTRCVENLGIVVVRDPADDAARLYQKLGDPDVITVEKEHVDIELMRAFAQHCPVHPNPDALEKFKNRLNEKRFLQSLDIPLAPFLSVSTAEDVDQAVATLAHPVFLKSQEQGYDGYNQWKLTAENAAEIKQELEFPGNWVAESFIPFEREVSFLAARARNGDVTSYPPVQNIHRNGTLLRSIAPALDLSADQLRLAGDYLQRMFQAVDYVGMICMECFVHEGRILVNEIAPRVHNSGHWTSQGASTSQFENHVRAVLGLPAGCSEIHGVSGMLNLLGTTLNAQEAVDRHTSLTLYNKITRPRRKLGHVTVNHPDRQTVSARMDALQKWVYGD